MERHNLSYRNNTHRAQQYNKTSETKFIKISQYCNQLNNFAQGYPLDEILNMDETPTLFDHVAGKTIGLSEFNLNKNKF